MQTEIKNIITSVNADSGVTLVTVYSLPNRTQSIARLFSELADAGVNVDMISLNPSQSVTQTVSFSADDTELSKILSVTGRFKASYPELRTDVNSSNCKLTFAGEGMRERRGVAAFVFEAFAERGIEVKLITTSETKISCLMDESGYSAAVDMLSEAFGIASV